MNNSKLIQTIEKSDEEAKRIFSEWLYPNFDMLEDFLASRDKALIEAVWEELGNKIKNKIEDISYGIGTSDMNQWRDYEIKITLEEVLAIITNETKV